VTTDGPRIPPGGVPLEARRTENVEAHAVDVHGCLLIELERADGTRYFTPVWLHLARVLANTDANGAAVRAILEDAGVRELTRELEENDGTNA